MLRGPSARLGATLALALACSSCTLLLDFDKEDLAGMPDAGDTSGSCSVADESDGFQNPTNIAAGLYQGLTICSLNDVDYYSFSLESGQSFEIEITYQEADGNLDIRLLDSGQASVATEEGTASPAILALTPADSGYPGAGIYVIEVFAAPEVESLDYTLKLTITDPTPIADAGPPDA